MYECGSNACNCIFGSRAFYRKFRRESHSEFWFDETHLRYHSVFIGGHSTLCCLRRSEQQSRLCGAGRRRDATDQPRRRRRRRSWTFVLPRRTDSRRSSVAHANLTHQYAAICLRLGVSLSHLKAVLLGPIRISSSLNKLSIVGPDLCQAEVRMANVDTG